MEKYLLIVLLLFCLIPLNSTGQNHPFICGQNNDLLTISLNSAQSTNSLISSTNGGVFTPKGRIRALVVFAGFKSGPFRKLPIIGWDTATNALPTVVDSVNGNIDRLFFDKYNTFQNIPDGNQSISRWFYDMSQGQFELIAEVLKDPNTGRPVRIDVPAGGGNNYSMITMQRQVLDTIKRRYNYAFNWSRFDTIRNNPNFSFSSDTTTGDRIIDFLIIIGRTDRRSFTDPQTNLTASFSFGGNAHVGLLVSANDFIGRDSLSYQISSSSGFTYNTGADFSGNLTFEPDFSPNSAIASTIHELGHMIINSPHICLNNGVLAAKMNMHNGLSQMNLRDSPISTCNAFESWYSGWSNLTSFNNISNYQSSRVYRLKDFFKSRDSSYLRIKIPGVDRNQYLWIENHSVDHPFHKRMAYIKDANNTTLPNSKLGLFAFVQDQQLIDSTSKIRFDLNPDISNGIRFLHSGGSSDFIAVDSGFIASEVWGNKVFTYRRGALNPFSEVSLTSRPREDLDTKFGSSFANTRNYIYQEKFSTNTGVQEQVEFMKELGGSSFDFVGIDMAFGRESNLEKMGISEKTAIVNTKNLINFQYQSGGSSLEKLEPTILNGVSVKLLAKYSDGSIDVEVKMNDTDIDKNQRFTGEIQLLNIEGANNDLNIKTGVTLTLNKSGNPNRRYQRNTGSYNRGYFPDFIFPSSLTCKTGSVLNMEQRSIFYVSDSSALVLDSGSTLNVGPNAFLGILNGSILKVKAGATLSISDSGLVEIKPGSQICIEEGAVVNLNNRGIIALRPGFYSGITLNNAFMIESNTCIQLKPLVLSSISISCICRPESLEFGANNPKLTALASGMNLRYNWKVISGSATLSDTASYNPFITTVGVNDSVTFRLMVTDSLNNYTIRDFPVRFTSDQRPIYHIKDDWDDSGVEQYKGYIYNSADLSIRTDSAFFPADSLPIHQNAIRKGRQRNINTANWLYAKVRNVGCTTGPSSSTGNQLHLYWTKASLGEVWTRDWLANIDINSFPTQLGGEEITNMFDSAATNNFVNSVITVSNIAPGNSKVYGHRWFPPRPQNYSGGSTRTEICVLARITDTSSGNGSMLPTTNDIGIQEATDIEISNNVRNFRAIATKNLFVYNDNPVNEFVGTNPGGGFEPIESYIEWGGTGTASQQSIELTAPASSPEGLFNQIDWRKIYKVQIILGQSLYNKMVSNLSLDTNINLLPLNYGFEVVGRNFSSASVTFDKTESYPVKVIFIRKPNVEIISPIDFVFRISAIATSDNRLLGSQQYNITASPVITQNPNYAALQFDGADDFVQTSTLPEYSFDDKDFSLGAMVKVHQKQDFWNHRILTVGNQGNNGYAWGLEENTDNSFTPYLTLGTTVIKSDVKVNADGNCHYTAVVKKSDKIEFYWDGKLLSIIGTSINGIVIPDGEPTLIGGVLPDTEEDAFFRGNLDNICIWQRSLSPNEIDAYQYNGKSIDEIANLISYWDFNLEHQVFVDQNVLDHYATLGTSVAVEQYDPVYKESCSEEDLKDSYNQGSSNGLEGSTQTGTVTRGLLIAPNPSESVFTVTLTELASLGIGGNGNVNFSVLSMSGVNLLQVTNQNLSSYTFQFQLNAAQGIYRLNVQSGNKVYNALLIKR